MLDAQIMSHVTKSVHKVKELEKGLIACKKAPNTESTANKTKTHTSSLHTANQNGAPLLHQIKRNRQILSNCKSKIQISI